jgi:hypothetical protein
MSILVVQYSAKFIGLLIRQAPARRNAHGVPSQSL